MAISKQQIYNNCFVVQRRISSGSFGVVHKGYDLRTSEYVAIKVEKSEVDDLMSLDREVYIQTKTNKIQILRKLNGVS